MAPVTKPRLKLPNLHPLADLVTHPLPLSVRASPTSIHGVPLDHRPFNLPSPPDGEPPPKHRLSAGEKQILAIALLWGLANASGRQLPVAIDTPPGAARLRAPPNHHGRTLLSPSHHHVMLLSTDTEIRPEGGGAGCGRPMLSPMNIFWSTIQSRDEPLSSGVLFGRRAYAD